MFAMSRRNARFSFIAAASIILLLQSACTEPEQTSPTTMPQKPRTTGQTSASGESESLFAKLQTLAASEADADQSELVKALSDEAPLERLDAEDAYVKLAPAKLRIATVIDRLSKNKSAHARRTLAVLTTSEAFTSVEARQQILITALSAVRPAPKEVINFWDAHSQEDSLYTERTIEAICVNASKPAIELLARKLADSSHDLDDRIMWMRYQILMQRNELPMLEGCETMVRSSLPDELKPYLIESLCDYKQDWYQSADPPEPPDRAKASKESREALLRICRHALTNVEMKPELEKTVQDVIAELERNRTAK